MRGSIAPFSFGNQLQPTSSFQLQQTQKLLNNCNSQPNLFEMERIQKSREVSPEAQSYKVIPSYHNYMDDYPSLSKLKALKEKPTIT